VKTGRTTVAPGTFGQQTYDEVDFGKDYDIKSFKDAGWVEKTDMYGNKILVNPIPNFV